MLTSRAQVFLLLPENKDKLKIYEAIAEISCLQLKDLTQKWSIVAVKWFWSLFQK